MSGPIAGSFTFTVRVRGFFLGFFVVRVCECGEHFSLDQQYISTAVRLEDVILILTCLYF